MTEKEIISRISSQTSRILGNVLRRQAPVKTGALRNSVQVSANFTGGTFTFASTYLYYGVFQDLGTGRYRTRATNRRAWNPRPGKGKGGIKPRFWTSLPDSQRQRINMILEKAFADYIKFTFFRAVL